MRTNQVDDDDINDNKELVIPDRSGISYLTRGHKAFFVVELDNLK